MSLLLRAISHFLIGLMCLSISFGSNSQAQSRLPVPSLKMIDELLDLTGDEAANWEVSHIDEVISKIIYELERVEWQYRQYNSEIGPFNTTSGAELSPDPTFVDLQIYGERHRDYIDRLGFERRRVEDELLRMTEFAELASELRKGVTELYENLVSNPVVAGWAAPVVQALQQTVHVNLPELDNKSHSLRADVEQYLHKIDDIILEEEPLLENFEANLETIATTMEITKKHCGTVKSPEKCPEPKSASPGLGFGVGSGGATGGISQ